MGCHFLPVGPTGPCLLPTPSSQVPMFLKSLPLTHDKPTPPRTCTEPRERLSPLASSWLGEEAKQLAPWLASMCPPPWVHAGAFFNYLKESNCRAARYKSFKLLLMVTQGRPRPGQDSETRAPSVVSPLHSQITPPAFLCSADFH